MQTIRNVDGLSRVPNKGASQKQKYLGTQRAAAVHPVRRAAARVESRLVTAQVLPRTTRARLSPRLGDWNSWKQHFSLKEIAVPDRTVLLSAFGVIIAFALGTAYAGTVPKSDAVDLPAQRALTPAASVPIPLASAPTGTAVPRDELFNTPLELLQSYMSSAAPDAVEVRRVKLREFLEQHDSPLASEADLIAEQPHWKLILAISFAESTLGKHCYINNCSGIGGSNIRTYKSVANWILDFNRLLEQRYKDDTLEQMCGVYVQPCNPNWLKATKQILGALDDAKIE